MKKTFTNLIGLVAMLCTFALSVFAVGAVQKQNIEPGISTPCSSVSQVSADISAIELPATEATETAFYNQARAGAGNSIETISFGLTLKSVLVATKQDYGVIKPPVYETDERERIDRLLPENSKSFGAIYLKDTVPRPDRI